MHQIFYLSNSAKKQEKFTSNTAYQALIIIQLIIRQSQAQLAAALKLAVLKLND